MDGMGWGWDERRSPFRSLHSLFCPSLPQTQIDELARFVPRLIYVGRGGGGEAGGSGGREATGAPPAAAGVMRAGSLAGALGL